MNLKSKLRPEDSYVCFHLRTVQLSAACRERLTRLGVECLSEGPACKAYGIITDVEKNIELLAQDPEVVLIERSDPPCSK